MVGKMRFSPIEAVSDTALSAAADALKRGELVSFPTETVYGLGGDATSNAAVAKIYAAKGRPQFNPLIAHCPDLARAKEQGVFNADAEALAAQFWPGPLTLVVPKRADASVCDLVTAGLESVALRVPANPVARQLLEKTGRPVAAPSANLSGKVSPTTARHVAEHLADKVAAILDGGACAVGLESTIVGCLDGKVYLLRPGGVPREALEAVLGRPLDLWAQNPENPNAPGQLTSHYAPNARMRLDAKHVCEGEGLLAFGPVAAGERERAAFVLNLSETGDLQEAATRLFACLRQLDETGVAAIAVQPVPTNGLGEAINDRLLRAAAPRP